MVFQPCLILSCCRSTYWFCRRSARHCSAGASITLTEINTSAEIRAVTKPEEPTTPSGEARLYRVTVEAAGLKAVKAKASEWQPANGFR